MGLKRTKLDIIPAGGTSTDKPAFHVSPGQWVSAQDVRQVRAGEFVKRNAMGASLFSYGGAATARELFAASDGTLIARNATNDPVLGGAFLYSTTDGANWNQASGAQGLPSAVTRSSAAGLREYAGGYAQCDSAISGSYCLVVGVPATVISFGVVDYVVISTTTAKVLSSGTITSTGFQPTSVRVIPTAGGFVVLMGEPSGSASASVLQWCRFTGATPAAPSAVVNDMVGSTTATPYWDAMYCATNTMINIAYRSAAGTMKVVEISPTTGSQGARSVTYSLTADNGVTLLLPYEAGGTFHVCECSSISGLVVHELSLSTFAVGGTQTMSGTFTNASRLTGYRSGVTTVVAAERSVADVGLDAGTAYRTVFCYGFVGTGTGTGGLNSFVRNACLVSRAGTIGTAGQYVMALATDETIAPWATLFTLDTGNPSAIGRLMFDSPGIPSSVMLPALSSLSVGEAWVTPLGRSGYSAFGSTFYSVNTPWLTRISRDDSAWSGAVEHADAVYFPGGFVTHRLGMKVQDAGILVEPEIHRCVGQPTGSMTASATYKYIVISKRRDSLGRLHRSIPSLPVSVTLTAGQNSVYVYIKTRWAGFNVAGDSHVIDVYRTIAGGDGTAYYRTGTATSESYADPAGFPFNDTIADASLQTGELLYTTGGVLPNVPPPPAIVVKAYRQRLFAIDADAIRYTSQNYAGFAPAWHAGFEIRFPGVTAAAVVDERLYLHRNDGIFVMSGDGPDELGNNLYARPEQVSTIQGATKAKLVAETPDGQWFVNGTGVYRFDRGHQAEYVGSPIENSFTPSTATKVLYVPALQQVRITTTAGVTWVYDMKHQLWSKDSGQTYADAVVWNGAFTGMPSALIGAQVESASSYRDQGTTNYVTLFKSGKLQPMGYDGWFRLWELHLRGDVVGACTVKVTITSHMGATSQSEVHNLAVSAVGEFNMACLPKYQVCTAFDFQVEDVFGGAATAGVKITSIVAWVGVREGGQMLPKSVYSTPV